MIKLFLIDEYKIGTSFGRVWVRDGNFNVVRESGFDTVFLKSHLLECLTGVKTRVI